MIRCSEAKNWIHRQLDDSSEDPLSPEETEMFRNHLETCPGCHHFLKELNSLRDLLQEVGQTEREEPRPNPRNRGKPPIPSWRDFRPRFILPAAASLLLAAGLFLAIFLAPSPSRPPTTASNAFRVNSPDEPSVTLISSMRILFIVGFLSLLWSERPRRSGCEDYWIGSEQ